MKTTNLKLVFSSLLILFLSINCKNEIKTESTTTPAATSKAADAEKKAKLLL